MKSRARPNVSVAVAESLGALAATFATELDDARSLAYAVGLEGLSDQQVQLAVATVLRSPKRDFMPTPGQLRELAVTGGQGYECVAQESFIQAERAARMYGGHRVNFEDRIINATVRLLGGLHKIPRSTHGDYPHYRREFLTTYVRLCSAEVTAVQSAPLPAHLECEGSREMGAVAIPRLGSETSRPGSLDDMRRMHGLPTFAASQAALRITQTSEDAPH